MNAITEATGGINPTGIINTDLMDNFTEYVDRSDKTTNTYKTNIKQFIKWLQVNGITQPQREDIKAYKNYLVKAGYKANTAASYLRSVCQLFKWTESEGIYPNIADNIHKPKADNTEHKKDALTPDEVLIIEKSIDEHAAEEVQKAEQAAKDRAGRVQRAAEKGKRLKAMYLLAVNAGLRTIEISRANVNDLEEKNGQAFLYVWGKGHSEADKKKAIAWEIYEAIKDYLNTRTDEPAGNDPLFAGVGSRGKAKNGQGKRIDPRTISTMLKDALKEAGFNSDRLTAHSLRHTAGTNTYNITHDIYITQEYMRHCDPKTTEIYIHADTEKESAQAAEDLYNLYHGKDVDDRKKLERCINAMTPAQIKELADIAEKMTR